MSVWVRASEKAKDGVYERKMVRRQAGRIKALENEMKEEVKWKGKLNIDVEQKVNNDGMIMLPAHNQPDVILPYEWQETFFTKK